MTCLGKITVSTAILLGISGCAAGIRGGIVSPDSEEAVPEHHPPAFIHDGERGTIEGMPALAYTMSRVEFGDSIVSLRVPDGWRVERQGPIIRLENARLDASMVIIRGLVYPDMEVASIHDTAEHDEEVEVSPLSFDMDARLTTTFAASTTDGLSLMYLGLMTDLDDPRSGVVLVGRWPTEHSDICTRTLLSVADSITISKRPSHGCTPRG